MAILKSKQISTHLSGSYVITGSLETTANISGSSTSTGSFGSVHVPDKIGIGITNPTEKLDVDGKIQIQGDTSTKVRAGDGGTTYGTLYSEGTTGDVELVLNSTGGASPDINFQVAGTAKAAIVSIAGSDDLRFRTNGNSTDQLIIDSSGHSTFTGNVVANGNISGSSTSTGSFGSLETSGNINSSGRIFESGTSVIDHATAMAIVFGG